MADGGTPRQSTEEGSLDMPRKLSTKEKLRQFFRNNVGRVIEKDELRAAAGNATEWARRVREIRNDEGWDIQSNNDSDELKPGQYRLVSEPPPEGYYYRFARQISSRLRAQVLARNGYTCQMCGVGAGDLDNRGKKVRLHVRHMVDKTAGGTDTLDNLKTLCAECNQGAKHLATEPPRWTRLLGQIRSASRADQQKALEWLQEKLTKS